MKIGLTFVSLFFPGYILMHGKIDPYDLTGHSIKSPYACIVTVPYISSLFWNSNVIEMNSACSREGSTLFISLLLRKYLYSSGETVFYCVSFLGDHYGLIVLPYSKI